MKVLITRGTAFVRNSADSCDGKLYKEGEEAPLFDESQFVERCMEWVEAPKAKKAPKAKAKAKAETEAEE